MGMFIPYGSYVYGESRDQDFYYTELKGIPLVEGAIEWNPPGRFYDYPAQQFLKDQGFPDPDIYCDPSIDGFTETPEFDILVIANLLADHGDLSGHLIAPSRESLIWAMKCNVDRWSKQAPTLKTLRKRLFSQTQLDAYEKAWLFLNSKSQITQYLIDAAGWLPSLAHNAMLGDGAALLAGSNPLLVYCFKAYCHYVPEGLSWESQRCEFFVKGSSSETVSLEVLETFTSYTRTHHWDAPKDVWEKMVELLLKEI